MSTQETEGQTPPPEENEAIDIEPIIRKIVQEETASTNEKLTSLEEKLGSLGELGETIEGLFKKHKPSSTKIDEDSLVEKIVGKLTGGTSTESGNGNEGEGTTSTGKRNPGPLSRFLGIS